jgi:hypothetical protein
MSTSGNTNFSITAEQIINDSHLLIGVIAEGEVTSNEQSSLSLHFLNMLTKHLAISANLWIIKDVTHTLTPGTESYTVGSGLNVDTPRPLRLKRARRRDNSGLEIEVEVISRDEYMSLPIKNTQAPALKVYYDPQLANGVLYVWPTGTSNNTTLKLTFQRPLEDFTILGNNPDFPQEWYMAIVYQLALKLQRIYLGKIDSNLAAEATALLESLKQFDEEQVSVKFSLRNR